MAEISNAGCKELLLPRMFMAIASGIATQFFFMTLVILITRLSVTHPLYWLQDTYSFVTCLRLWCYFFVLVTIIFLQVIICSRNYLTAPPYLKSRFNAFWAMFTPHNFFVGGLYLTISVVLVWLHLSLEGGEYHSLTTYCTSKEGTCLVEKHYFLLLGGLWAGLYYFTKTNFFGPRYLQFPIIPQSKIVQVKRGVGDIAPSAMISAIWPTLYLLGLYYFLGTYFRGFVVTTLFLSMEEEPLDGFSRLLNLSLMIHAWLYTALFVFTMDTMHILFQAYLTEWMAFDIGHRVVFGNEKPMVTLPEALAMDKIPIVQHLSYYDLVTVAQKDKTRRELLFTLSQPGGHPYNWNCVVEKCLALVKNFATEINEISSAKQERQISPTSKNTVDVLGKNYAYHMRNLVSAQPKSPIVGNDPTTQDTGLEQIITGYLKNFKQNCINYLLSKPLIYYFFGTQCDSKLKHLLINGQLIIWAVDAISSLAAVSIKEDPYGIVQKDLSAIVETLLSLKQSLDKLQKTNLLIRKPQNDDKTIRLMLTSLRMATKRSIYRIVTTFKDYIDDLELEQPARDQLQTFLAYRE